MSAISPGTCRYCGCTEHTPCNVPPYNEGDTCGWIEGTMRTVCNAPPCASAWLKMRRAVAAARPRKLSSAEVHQRIMQRGRRGSRGSRGKKGRAA